MEDSVSLLTAFLRKYPDIQQLPPAKLHSAFGDIFAGDKGKQQVAVALVNDGKFYNLSSENLPNLVLRYSMSMNIDRDIVSHTITVCLTAVDGLNNAPSQPTQPKKPAAPKPSAQKPPQTPKQPQPSKPSGSKQPSCKTPKKGFVKARNKAEKQKQLDAHPRKSYPSHTFWEKHKDDIPELLSYLGRALWWMFLFAIGAGVLYFILYIVSRIFDLRDLGFIAYIAFGIGVVAAIYYAIRDYKELHLESLSRPINQDYYPKERLRQILLKKGISRKAEKILRDASNFARAHKDDADYDVYKLSEICERAYQDALEDVLCYLNEDERWGYLEANEDYRKGISPSFDLSTYRGIYMNYLKHDDFYDIADDRHIIFKRFMFNKPNFSMGPTL